MRTVPKKPRSSSPAFEQLLRARLTRRDLLKGAGAFAALTAATALSPLSLRSQPPSTVLNFQEVPKGYFASHQIPPGYEAQLLLCWGDGLFADAPAFDPKKQSAAAQARQFGYNCDFIAYFPFPRDAAANNRALLCVNHEYVNSKLMFPGSSDASSDEKMRIEMEAHGVSIVEIFNHDGRWQPIIGSPLGRRITGTTPIAISGPAAGHARMKTAADKSGKRVLGTLNNCGGGMTPWGTYLTCEENFDEYFLYASAGKNSALDRYGFGQELFYDWHKIDPRFDTAKEPNEPNRFGWVVEIDPYDPKSTPVKRTALGRFKHESATCVLSKSGHVVIYSGDDEKFEYLYRYVSDGAFDPASKKSQSHLLDKGTLSVATFSEDGSLIWLPLVHGKEPLNEKNGFSSQAEVLIETRRAADLLGATPMDRPEDVEVDLMNQHVFVSLTNNDDRKAEQVDKANPRANNKYGHIIELIPPEGDHTAEKFQWEIFLLAGDPRKSEDNAYYGGGVSENGWLTCPDNLAFDPKGRLWIATDGQPKTKGISDGLYATEISGQGKARPRQFLTVPKGAECTGPCFSPDGATLFISVQHPGDDKLSSFDKPSTRWPDFKEGIPPRPSILAIVKKDGGEIGS